MSSGGLVGRHVLNVFADDQTLVMRQTGAFDMDKDWRDDFKDFPMIRDRYERKHRSDLVDQDTPYANLMQGLVSEFTGTLLPNIPGCRLQALTRVDPSSSKLERMIRAQLIQDSEEAANILVSASLFENDFRKHLVASVLDAGIYGAGSLKIDLESFGTSDKDYKLQYFLRKWKEGKISKKEINDFIETSGRLCVTHIPQEQVYWEYGKAAVDESMRRVSTLEEVSTMALANEYPDLAHQIMDGAGMTFDEISTRDEISEEYNIARADDNSSATGSSDFSQILTTWEAVDIWHEINDEVSVPERVIVRTEIASGDILLNKTIITTDGLPVEWCGIDDMYPEDGEEMDDGVDYCLTFETEAGSNILPIVQFVTFTDTKHPYGRSMIEQMMVHEDVYNNVIAIIMAYSNRGLENGKIFLAKSAMAKGESASISQALEDPSRKIIEIEGNDPYGESPDIRRMVMTFQNLVAQPPAMLVRIAEMILADFQRLAGMADQSAIAKSRSAAGKRTQLATADRPKILPLENISDAMERVYDLSYQVFQAIYYKQAKVSFMMPGGISGTIEVNKKVMEPVPELNGFGEPISDPAQVDLQNNPLGLIQQYRPFVLNSNQIYMKGVADGRAGLPHDPVARTNQLSLWMQLGWITPETARYEGLPQQIKERDDARRSKSEMEQQRAQLAAMKEQMAQTNQAAGQMADQVAHQQGGGQGGVQDTFNAEGALPGPDQITTPPTQTQVRINRDLDR